MPRITISIPTALKERLDNPQVRKSINVSRVCHRNPDIVRGDPASVGSYKDASNFRAWRLA